MAIYPNIADTAIMHMQGVKYFVIIDVFFIINNGILFCTIYVWCYNGVVYFLVFQGLGSWMGHELPTILE